MEKDIETGVLSCEDPMLWRNHKVGDRV